MDGLPIVTDAIPQESKTAWADWAGMLASVGCAIHCAAMPFVIGYLPLLGISWLADESFHQVMTLVCFAFAVLAFVPGWKKHSSLVPALVGSAGIAVLAFAAFGVECSCCPTDEAAGGTQASASACSDENCQVCAQEATNQEIAPQGTVVHATAQEEANESEYIVSVGYDEDVEVEASETSIDSALADFAPFLSPIGGALLVVGHLVNHRKGCKCQDDGCCLS